MKRLIVCKCVGTHEAWFLAAPVHILDDSPLFLQLQTYFMDGLFFNQKTNNNIQISYSLKYKHSKKEYILYEKIKSKNQSYNVSYALYGNYFCKEKLLLSRSTSAAGLHLLTFHILEPYPSKVIAPGVSHVISHQWHYYCTLSVLFESVLLSSPTAKIWLQYSGKICFFNAMLWKRFFKAFVWDLSSEFAKQWK